MRCGPPKLSSYCAASLLARPPPAPTPAPAPVVGAVETLGGRDRAAWAPLLASWGRCLCENEPMFSTAGRAAPVLKASASCCVCSHAASWPARSAAMDASSSVTLCSNCCTFSAPSVAAADNSDSPVGGAEKVQQLEH